MTSYTRSLTTLIDTAALLRALLIFALLLIIVLGAAWLVLTPTSVADVQGPVVQKWTELDGAASPVYWVELRGERGVLRCSVAAYQTGLVNEWQTLHAGQTAKMTCYGQSAVHLTTTP